MSDAGGSPPFESLNLEKEGRNVMLRQGMDGPYCQLEPVNETADERTGRSTVHRTYAVLTDHVYLRPLLSIAKLLLQHTTTHHDDG